MHTRRHVLQALPAAALMISRPVAAAPAWQPSKPIDFLVMAGKGGGADQAVRFLIKIITDRQWSAVPINVVNMPGGSGLEALVELAERKGDAHTLLFTLNSFYTAPITSGRADLDVTRFSAVARMAEDNFLLWVSTSHADVTTMDEFVAKVRRAGASWRMGGTGNDSEDQLLCDFLNVSYDLKMSYKAFGGGGAVAKALAEATVEATVNNPSEAIALMKEGKVKPLVSFSPNRLPEFNTIPALRETGMSFSYSMQRSVVGPPDLPAAAAAYYAGLFSRLYDGEEWQAYRKENSLFGEFLTGPQLTRYWGQEREKHRRWLMAMKAMRGN